MVHIYSCCFSYYLSGGGAGCRALVGFRRGAVRERFSSLQLVTAFYPVEVTQSGDLLPKSGTFWSMDMTLSSMGPINSYNVAHPACGLKESSRLRFYKTFNSLMNCRFLRMDALPESVHCSTPPNLCRCVTFRKKRGCRRPVV